MPRLSNAYQALLRSYINSERLNAVSWGAEALYVRLLAVADGEGRYWGDAHAIACQVAMRRLGRSTTAEQIEGFLVELESVGLIWRWKEDALYLQIWEFFQGGGRKRPARYPECRSVPIRPHLSPHGDTRCQSVPTCPPDQGSERREHRAVILEPPASDAEPPSRGDSNPRKSRRLPDTDHAALIDWWCRGWKKTRGLDYAIEAKDAAAVKALLTLAKNHGGLEEIKRRGKALLMTTDPWLHTNASLTIFRSRWNQLGVNGHASLPFIPSAKEREMLRSVRENAVLDQIIAEEKAEQTPRAVDVEVKS